MKWIMRKENIDFKKMATPACLFAAMFATLIYLANIDVRALFENPKTSMDSFSGTLDLYDPNTRDSDGDGLSDGLEYIFGTDPAVKDTDGDGYFDLREIWNGYDPTAPGEASLAATLRIDRLKVSAPMVWSESSDDASELADLQKGVSRYPGSASPGQVGNMIVSGHSSNYVWVKGNYNYIFKNLNQLEAGDFIEVEMKEQSGREIINRYAVKEKFVAFPDDDRIFAETKNASLTLSTCWPLGTNFRRLIVKADLVNQN
jgi:LPXTG-site transpeptidase (sortase) family protein